MAGDEIHLAEMCMYMYVCKRFQKNHSKNKKENSKTSLNE